MRRWNGITDIVMGCEALPRLQRDVSDLERSGRQCHALQDPRGAALPCRLRQRAEEPGQGQEIEPDGELKLQGFDPDRDAVQGTPVDHQCQEGRRHQAEDQNGCNHQGAIPAQDHVGRRPGHARARVRSGAKRVAGHAIPPRRLLKCLPSQSPRSARNARNPMGPNRKVRSSAGRTAPCGSPMRRASRTSHAPTRRSKAR